VSAPTSRRPHDDPTRIVQSHVGHGTVVDMKPPARECAALRVASEHARQLAGEGAAATPMPPTAGLTCWTGAAGQFYAGVVAEDLDLVNRIRAREGLDPVEPCSCGQACHPLVIDVEVVKT
jgi:hypothetical protein